MPAQSRQKTAAQCRNCGKALAVWQTANGIQPIGSAGGCPCGSTSFRLFD